MLQQTTVRTVGPYFERFLARFPTIRSLAAATEDDVLALWAGLGYYHRARNLRRGAIHILERHGGRFPRTLEAALAVPGVGMYTASAVLSIAYGVPLAVVDGNVRRVLTRLMALRGPRWTRTGALHNLATELLARNAPGDWNQAVMELGATVCAPRNPECPACPLRDHCRGRALGLERSLPAARNGRTPVRVTVAAALIRSRNRVLFARRPSGRLMGEMWEIPQTPLDAVGRPRLEEEVRRRYGIDIRVGALLATARHAITYRRIRLEAYEATLSTPVAPHRDTLRWVALHEVAGLPTSSMTRKLVAALDSPQRPLPLE
jgi:A/G-specific adenine glycosylase